MVLEDGSGVASASLYTKTQFIKDIQKCINARVDGKAGEETLSKTVTVSVDINRTHAVVRYIQKYLNSLGYDCGSVDGIAGAKFKKGVVKFQKAKGCVADGVITAKQKTWQKLLGMC
jgi:peptidoglycan hydrolase-like protein with peptidoglycan-binding domain